MYFLPFQSRVRFMAFKDIPEVEQELSQWLVTGRTWDEISSNSILNNNIVTGVPAVGIFFQKDKSFITNNIGSPQIEFSGNPKSLLFIMSDYKIATNSGSIYYDTIIEDYTRREISAHAYEPSTNSLEVVWNRLNQIDRDKVSNLDIQTLTNIVNKSRSDISKLAKRNDPLTAIMPALAAEIAERRTVINDILQQLDDIQAPVAEGVVDVTNYPTKTEFYDQINRRASKGYVDGLLGTKASEADFTSHIFDENLHNPTYSDVGAPSIAQFQALANRVTALEDAIEELQALNPIKSLTSVGGVLVNNQGNGVWRIDSSGIGTGTGDKPQETSFFFGGPLTISLNNAGGWIAWEDGQIIGIRATLGQAPVGAPVVVDLLKEGVSIYADNPGNRPTFLDGEDEVFATLPDDVEFNANDEITVDIINVGLSVSGADLNIQMRYQYAS